MLDKSPPEGWNELNVGRDISLFQLPQMAIIICTFSFADRAWVSGFEHLHYDNA